MNVESLLARSRASRSGSYKVLKCLKETSPALPKVKITPSSMVRKPKVIKNTGEKIRRSPRWSMLKLTSASGVSYGTMQTVLDKGLSLFPLQDKHKLSHCLKTKRPRKLLRARILSASMRDGTDPPIQWTDEKLFLSRQFINIKLSDLCNHYE